MKVKMSQRTFAVPTSLHVGGSSICAGTYPDTANGTIDNKLNKLFILNSRVPVGGQWEEEEEEECNFFMFGDERCFSHNQ